MKNVIENHKKAAKHSEESAKNHHEAAKHHEEGNHEKANHSTVLAHGHTQHTVEAEKEIVKHHAVKK